MRPFNISTLCLLFGFTRQGYYKHRNTDDERNILIDSIVLYCFYLRERENIPKAGCRELYEMCKEYFGDKFIIGRDRFFAILRDNHLMIRRRHYRPRTTDSRHNYHIYPDLLNTSPKLSVYKNGQLVVADITYIRLVDGNFAYLSLVTDAFSRMIVGHSLQATLKTEGPLEAISRAIDFYKQHNIDVNGLIHHSDRGIQYASEEYVSILKENGLIISMTQSGDPLHNALAERMNNTLKNGWMFNNNALTLQEANDEINRAVLMYNTARPHQSIGMKTPMQMVDTNAINPLLRVSL